MEQGAENKEPQQRDKAAFVCHVVTFQSKGC